MEFHNDVMTIKRRGIDVINLSQVHGLVFVKSLMIFLDSLMLQSSYIINIRQILGKIHVKQSIWCYFFVNDKKHLS